MDARISLHMQIVESDTIYEIHNTAEWSRDIRTLLQYESLESSHASLYSVIIVMYVCVFQYTSCTEGIL